jgi:hypothetical protein
MAFRNCGFSRDGLPNPKSERLEFTRKGLDTYPQQPESRTRNCDFSNGVREEIDGKRLEI